MFSTFQSGAIFAASRTIYSLKSLLVTLQGDLSIDDIDRLETQAGSYLGSLSSLSRYVPVNTISQIRSLITQVESAFVEKRNKILNQPDILYPPEYVFPRNPDISKLIKPISISNETYNDNGTGLSFEFGYTGVLNVIKTKFPPYLNRLSYNFSTKNWAEDQIKVKIQVGNKEIIAKDITPYFSNSIVNFTAISTNLDETVVYYFDGEKIVTNFDFSSVEDRKKVFVTYSKLLNSLRVKAVVNTNKPGISFYTPVIDQFTMLVDKQRVLS